MTLKKSLHGFILGFSVIFLILFLSTSLIIFHNNIIQRNKKLTIQNISQIQELYKQSVQSKFTDMFNMLEAQARFFEDVDLKNESELQRAIKSTRGIGDYKKIAVCTKKGKAYNYNNQPVADLFNKDIFIDTFTTGKEQISNRIELDESLEPVLTLSYPLKNKKITEAMLVGTLSYKVLQDLFAVSVFEKQSYSYIIAKDGNVILCNNSARKTLYNVNFNQYIYNENKEMGNDSQKMMSDIAKNLPGYILYDGKVEKLLLIYSPLGINNWYIVTILPYTYIQNQRSIIELPVFIILGIIVFAIFAFSLTVYLLFRTNTTIEKDNERLTIANNQTQSLIFEYDIQRGLVIFSGDTTFILGTDKKIFEIEFVRKEYYKRVHPDDVTVFQHLKESFDKKLTDFSSEFRYKSFSNKYIWVRMTASTISKEDGTIVKYIGTINNVNAQVLHEQELKAETEVDKLTGLLNKTAMENRIKDFIKNHTPENNSALFIIDLDNFKSVNDNLGHLIGDQAIMDAAKKLSLIFSEKDYISRFGGDEFCVLLKLSDKLSKDTANTIINDKARSVCKMLQEIYFDEKNRVEITVSVGISLFSEEKTTSYDDWFKIADSSLYKVKQNGKNNFIIA